MVAVLGINAVFHDPAAALVVDGRVVAAAEEERFTRRKHGKPCVPFSTWELPEHAMRWCLEEGSLDVSDLDAIAYSYDPTLAPRSGDVTSDDWEGLRTLFAERAGRFVATALPGADPEQLRFVPHHLAHAASAYGPSPYDEQAVMVLDGRGERSSYLAGFARDGIFSFLAHQPLPHSLGLLYEEVTEHLGFRRSSDEYKVMALASYAEPAHLGIFREHVRTDGAGGFVVDPLDLAAMAKRRRDEDDPLDHTHAELAASLQARLEEVLVELARWLKERTGSPNLVLAGGVALNCVANARLARESGFYRVWVQPAAGDAGTALGAAAAVAFDLGDHPRPMTTAALGRGFDDDEVEACLRRAAVAFRRPADLAGDVAGILAENRVVGWFQGRSEFGPRALGHRSLLCDPRDPANVDRLNAIKGRETFRPVAPMVLSEDAHGIFSGVLPSPYMLFVHKVRPEWIDRIPAAVHVDGTARAQTVDPAEEPLVAAVLEAFRQRTGVPVVINTSFNTAGRPMVDTPQDALECFGSSPIDALAIGPFLVERPR